jgi:hypothetical protein
MEEEKAKNKEMEENEEKINLTLQYFYVVSIFCISKQTHLKVSLLIPDSLNLKGLTV